MGLSGAVAPQWPVAGSASASTPSRTEPGVLDEFLTMIGRKFREAAENLINTAGEAVNRNVREGVPKLVDAAGEMATERLTPGESRTPRYAGFTG
jgi:hypothetical protein